MVTFVACHPLYPHISHLSLLLNYKSKMKKKKYKKRITIYNTTLDIIIR